MQLCSLYNFHQTTAITLLWTCKTWIFEPWYPTFVIQTWKTMLLLFIIGGNIGDTIDAFCCFCRRCTEDLVFTHGHWLGCFVKSKGAAISMSLCKTISSVLQMIKILWSTGQELVLVSFIDSDSGQTVGFVSDSAVITIALLYSIDGQRLNYPIGQAVICWIGRWVSAGLYFYAIGSQKLRCKRIFRKFRFFNL